MTRRIRLACEDCDYSAEMAERIPFAFDGAGAPQELPPESTATPDGYLSDWLCGECRRPVRLRVVEGDDTGAAPNCPRCGAAMLSFDVAARELAEASRSRVGRDLAAERDGAGRVHAAMESVAGLEKARENGDQTTQGALDLLASALTPQPGEPHADELAATVALGGLPKLIENSLDMNAARSTLKKREEMSAKHIAVLEQWRRDERQLPGVPCPQCEKGQLIHWPVWV